MYGDETTCEVFTPPELRRAAAEEMRQVEGAYRA